MTTDRTFDYDGPGYIPTQALREAQTEKDNLMEEIRLMDEFHNRLFDL